jgi:hypothetical protein
MVAHLKAPPHSFAESAVDEDEQAIEFVKPPPPGGDNDNAKGPMNAHTAFDQCRLLRAGSASANGAAGGGDPLYYLLKVAAVDCGACSMFNITIHRLFVAHPTLHARFVKMRIGTPTRKWTISHPCVWNHLGTAQLMPSLTVSATECYFAATRFLQNANVNANPKLVVHVTVPRMFSQ